MAALIVETRRVERGDMRGVEAMLAAQGVTLNAMFTQLPCQASKMTIVDQIDRFTRLALKAQGQCLRDEGPALVSIIAPPGFGKSALLARTVRLAMPFSKTVDELTLLFVGRQGADSLTVGLTYAPPPVPNRLATVLHNFQSYTAAPRQTDLDKFAELTPVARDAGERVKQAKLNKAMNDAGIPHTPCARALAKLRLNRPEKTGRLRFARAASLC